MVVAWAPLPKPCKPDTSSVVPLFKAPKGQEKFAGTHLATSKTNENDVDIGSTEIRKKNLQTTASSSTPTSCGMHTVMFYGWFNLTSAANSCTSADGAYGDSETTTRTSKYIKQVYMVVISRNRII